MFLSQSFRASSRVAVVTGGNKGIGYEIVRGLVRSDKFDKVYLTARNENLGKVAVNTLRLEESANCIDFHPLDVSNPNSISTFADFITAKHAGLDVLVQNAGIAPLPWDSNDQTILEQTILTFNTNFWGVLNMMKKFEPITNRDGRIVLLSSFLSQQAIFDFEPHWMANPISRKLSSINATISIDEIEGLAKQYISDVENDQSRWPSVDIPSNNYAMTKLFVNNIARIYGYGIHGSLEYITDLFRTEMANRGILGK